jgi:hypothetical protein
MCPALETGMYVKWILESLLESNSITCPTQMIDAVKPRYSEAGTIVYLSICFGQFDINRISLLQHTEFIELQNKFSDILLNWKF